MHASRGEDDLIDGGEAEVKGLYVTEEKNYGYTRIVRRISRIPGNQHSGLDLFATVRVYSNRNRTDFFGICASLLLLLLLLLFLHAFDDAPHV